MISPRRAINAYVQNTVENGVAEADPHRLVAMLFEGAIQAIAEARVLLEEGDIPGRGRAISRAIAIVEEGLRESLSMAEGGELAERLDGLYRYVRTLLLTANIKAEETFLVEADRLLTELQSGWKTIATPRPPSEAMHVAAG
jgi:flagellar secretion chaperone FliS